MFKSFVGDNLGDRPQPLPSPIDSSLAVAILTVQSMPHLMASGTGDLIDRVALFRVIAAGLKVGNSRKRRVNVVYK